VYEVAPAAALLAACVDASAAAARVFFAGGADIVSRSV